ncbi:hypothetical protein GJV85_03585 [Sulfurimonas aquatica]|uniref:Aminoglycoside N(3)-acetyltransferase n=1 Tax=Sulfurimonas aquatica TaxID=2672570 RepID=A0A975AZ39_9BACT|nr:AAC(3) family N-acetyltransferase [Sulfurimonas aquatica]QSZ41232.1 hypothetical protein GJV85_03585 [Sulfurimonas aquatica]
MRVSTNSLISLHIDIIGFFYYPVEKEPNCSINDMITKKLESFGKVLCEVENRGGNIIIPTFSHSYNTDELKTYDYLNSPSVVGHATEYLRSMFPYKRTIDPMFSYLVFSKNKKLHHFNFINKYNSMGEGSLIEELLRNNGSLMSIGNVLKRMTEAHYLERKIEVYYRHDVNIQGIFLDEKQKFYEQIVTIYGRHSGLVSDFTVILEDLKLENKYFTYNIGNFKLDSIRFNDLFTLMQKKYKEDKEYFVCTVEEKYKKDRN